MYYNNHNDTNRYQRKQQSERKTTMQEIKCPKCGEAFAVDESGYAQIVQQVRDKEFEKELLSLIHI